MSRAQEERKGRIERAGTLLAERLSHKQIGAQLGVHPRTIAEYAAVLREGETKEHEQNAEKRTQAPN